MVDEPRPIPEDLVAFIEGGGSILVGTRNAALRPYAMRAVGLTIHHDRRTVTVYLPDATAERALADLRDNARIAITFTRPIDHRSIQLKGAATKPRPATEAERPILEKCVDGFAEHVEVVGLPRQIGSRLTYWPSTAVDVSVESVFVQTPGPSAGIPFVAAARS